MKLPYLFVFSILLFPLQTIFAISSNPSTFSCVVTSTLKIGSRGIEVQCLQNKIGVSSDGIFGPLTYAAVKIFQNTHNLKPDGIIGPLSRAQLNNILADTTTTTDNKFEIVEKKVDTTNPNLKNLDSYITAVKKGALKGGLSKDKLPLLEDKHRKEAAMGTDFVKEFFDNQKDIYNKKISKTGSMLSFLYKIFSIKKAQAIAALPFGGFIVYANPLICDCPPGVITQLFVALPEANPKVSNLLLNYVNGSEAFSYYNIPEPSIAVLGFYEPNIPSCWTYVGSSCVLIESEGQITPDVGSSLAP